MKNNRSNRKRRCMNQQTYFLLNLLTMRSPDPKVNAELKRHQCKVFNANAPAYAMGLSLYLVFALVFEKSTPFLWLYRASKYLMIFLIMLHYRFVRDQSWGSSIFIVTYAITALLFSLQYGNALPSQFVLENKNQLNREIIA